MVVGLRDRADASDDMDQGLQPLEPVSWLQRLEPEFHTAASRRHKDKFDCSAEEESETAL